MNEMCLQNSPGYTRSVKYLYKILYLLAMDVSINFENTLENLGNLYVYFHNNNLTKATAKALSNYISGLA